MQNSTIVIADHVWYRYIKEKAKNDLLNNNNTDIPTPIQYDVAILKDNLPTKSTTTRTLFSEHPRHTSVAKFLVHMVRLDGTLLFTLFDNYLKFAIYQKKFTLQARTFFETILGEKSQKPHFDIDIDITPENKNMNFEDIKDSLIEQIINVLDGFHIKIKLNTDIVICTSHREDKVSYHIIVNNYSHANNIEAKHFYELVKKNIPNEYKQYIDHKVYSSLQQFRILGSHKIGKNNIKVFNEIWKYKGKVIKYMYPTYVESENHKLVLQLTASLVTTTEGCKILPILVPEKAIKRYDDPNWTGITKEEAEKAIQLLADKNSVSYKDHTFPFILDDINDHFIVLKRRYASSCRICNRIHEHENPYLFVVGNQKSVWFDCRRSIDNKKFFVGKIYPDNDPDYQDAFGLNKYLNIIRESMEDLEIEDIDEYMLKVGQDLENKYSKKKESDEDNEDNHDNDDVDLEDSSLSLPKTVPKYTPYVPIVISNNKSVVTSTSSPIFKVEGVVPDIVSLQTPVKIIPLPFSLPSPLPQAYPLTHINDVCIPNPIVNPINSSINTSILPFPVPIPVPVPVPVSISIQVNIPSNKEEQKLSLTNTKINPVIDFTTPFKPTNLEPNYGSDFTTEFHQSTSNFSVNPFDEILIKVNLSKIKEETNKDGNSVDNTSKKFTFKTKPKFVFQNETSIPSKFDQLDELERWNSVSTSTVKIAPKKKAKGTSEQLMKLFTLINK